RLPNKIYGGARRAAEGGVWRSTVAHGGGEASQARWGAVVRYADNGCRRWRHWSEGLSGGG
ncbi:hypothetical protein U1Q18_030521, partial [Sarracenia purpurea var. burkii]